MIKTSVEKLAKEIGFDIANSDDVIQSDLLNGLFEGMRNSMTDQQIDMQMCYVVDKLSDKTMKMIKILHNFIELKTSK